MAIGRKDRQDETYSSGQLVIDRWRKEFTEERALFVSQTKKRILLSRDWKVRNNTSHTNIKNSLRNASWPDEERGETDAGLICLCERARLGTACNYRSKFQRSKFSSVKRRNFICRILAVNLHLLFRMHRVGQRVGPSLSNLEDARFFGSQVRRHSLGHREPRNVKKTTASIAISMAEAARWEFDPVT